MYVITSPGPMMNAMHGFGVRRGGGRDGVTATRGPAFFFQPFILVLFVVIVVHFVVFYFDGVFFIKVVWTGGGLWSREAESR